MQPIDAAMLALPVVLIALTIASARWSDPNRTVGAPHRSWSVAEGAKRALTGLPHVAVPARPVSPSFTPLTSPPSPPADPVAEAAEVAMAVRDSAPAIHLPSLTIPGQPARAVKEPTGIPPVSSAVVARRIFDSPLTPAAEPTPEPLAAGPENLDRLQEIAIARSEPTAIALSHDPAPTSTDVGPGPPIAVRTPTDGVIVGDNGAGQCVPVPPKSRPVRDWRELATQGPDAFGLALAQAARDQLDDFVIYNDRYTRLAYPMGDVHPMYGVCTDVVVRAYRALGLDLQELVQKTRTGSGDPNIDHRRVDTLRRFFASYGESLPISSFAEDYRPGDIVTYYRPQNSRSRTHIAVVSDMTTPSGRPLIIHNRGWGPQQEDGLFVDKITGHYRFHGLLDGPLAAAGPRGKQPPRPQENRLDGGARRDVLNAGLPAARTPRGSQ